MLYFFIGFSLIDGIWGLFMSRTLGQNALGFEIFTYGFHGMAALSAFMWSGYMVKYTKAEDKEDYLLTAIRYSLLLIQFYVFISNFWNHEAFTVTENAEYLPGTMRTVMFILQFTKRIRFEIWLFILSILSIENRKPQKTYGIMLLLRYNQSKEEMKCAE